MKQNMNRIMINKSNSLFRCVGYAGGTKSLWFAGYDSYGDQKYHSIKVRYNGIGLPKITDTTTVIPEADGTTITNTNGVLSANVPTYTAGTGIDITNGVISINLTSAESEGF